MYEAQRWNLSPERLYLDFWTRFFLRNHLTPDHLNHICNVGVGAGEFDDWLGYWNHGRARLSGIDVEPSIIHMLTERQRIERHLYPTEGVVGGLFQIDHLKDIDLITAVGSTLHETANQEEALTALQRWLKPGGLLYVTQIHWLSSPE
ncbi:MAG: methyltransferase domain-containing protein [Myxococcota bacterium]